MGRGICALQITSGNRRVRVTHMRMDCNCTREFSASCNVFLIILCLLKSEWQKICYPTKTLLCPCCRSCALAAGMTCARLQPLESGFSITHQLKWLQMFLCYFSQRSSEYLIFHLFSVLCCMVGRSSAATGQKPAAGEQKGAPGRDRQVLSLSRKFGPSHTRFSPFLARWALLLLPCLDLLAPKC